MSERQSELKIPPLRRGWLQKQSRKGVVRNWKKRFFVLHQGKISYYVDELPSFPYGDNLKGEMNLVNTELIEDKYGVKQIFIASFNGENNILMEADNAEDAKIWCAAIRQHIHYANRETEVAVKSGVGSGSFASSSSSGRPVSMSAPSSTATSTPPAPSPTPAPASSTTSSAPAPSSPPVPPPRPATTTSTAPAAASTPAAPATQSAPIADAPDLLQFGENVIDFATKIAADNDFRNDFVQKLQPKVMSAVTAVMDNLYEGEPGNRGEKILGVAALLFIMIIFGIFPRLLILIVFSLKIVATLMIAMGLALSSSAVMDLGDSMSLFLIPNTKNHKIVSQGAYSIVRHPMYGGIILFTFGWSILKDNSFQVLLSILLAMVLNQAAEIEEDHLEKKHPKAYPLYASNRKVLIPFFY